MKLPLIITKETHIFTEVIDPSLIDWIDPHNVTTRKDAYLVVRMLGCMSELRAKIQSMAPERLEAVRCGQLRLILDNSLEGNQHSPSMMTAWHEAFKEFGIPPTSVYHLTQDRNFSGDYGKWCLEQKYSDKIHVYTYHYFYKALANKLITAEPSEWADKRLKFLSLRADQRSKKFVSLNYKLRSMRLRFLLSIIRDGLWDVGTVSFGGLEQDKLINAAVTWHRQDPIAVFRNMKGAKNYIPYLNELLTKGEVIVGSDVKRTSGNRVVSSWLILDRDDAIYRDTYLTAVMETEMTSSDTRITEKMLKPLVNFHPLIAFGNYRSLEIVRGLGFRTFSEVIDESYDEVRDPIDRFDAAYREFVRLVSLPEAQLRDWYYSIFSILEENSRRLYFEFHPFLVETMDKDLVAKMQFTGSNAVDTSRRQIS